jgi:hypothetical protein
MLYQLSYAPGSARARTTDARSFHTLSPNPISRTLYKDSRAGTMRSSDG